jgi:hypothetical protein
MKRKKMKNIIVIFVLLIQIVPSTSAIQKQSQLFYITNVMGSITYSRYLFYDDKQNLYLADEQSKNIQLQNISKNISYNLILPDTVLYKGFCTFLIDKDTLFYTDWRYLHSFKILNDTAIHLFSTLISNPSYNLKKIEDKVFIFSVLYSSVSIETGHITNVEIINIRNKNHKRLTFPAPSAAGFSFFVPNKVIDVDTNYIFLSDYDKYRIILYDYDSNPVDSILCNPSEWIYYKGEIPKYPEKYYYPKNFISKIQPFADTTSLIRSINKIGDNSLLVCWSIPKGYDFQFVYKYDLWTKTSDRWKLVFQGLDDFPYKENSILDSNSFTFQNDFRVNGEYIIIPNKGSTVDLFKNSYGKNITEYKEKCELFFIDNDLQTLIGVFKLK